MRSEPIVAASYFSQVIEQVTMLMDDGKLIELTSHSHMVPQKRKRAKLRILPQGQLQVCERNQRTLFQAFVRFCLINVENTLVIFQMIDRDAHLCEDVCACFFLIRIS